MAGEVSSYMTNVSLEIADLFGIDRDSLIDRFIPNPEALDARWGRIDWDDYLNLMKAQLNHIGKTGEELIPVGQYYLRNQFKTRNAHLYAQFGSWRQMLWVTKTFMVKRLVRGMAQDHRELGKNYFNVTITLDESRDGYADFLYFMIGVWTGSSRMADLHHEIEIISVTDHRAEANILFDSRAFASRVVHNPVYSRLKTWTQLFVERKDQQRLNRTMRQEAENVQTALDALTSPVFSVMDGQITAENRPAELLRNESASDHSAAWVTLFDVHESSRTERLAVGERIFLRQSRPLNGTASGSAYLVTLEDQTDLVHEEQMFTEIQDGIRRKAGEQLNRMLGSELESLADALDSLKNQRSDGMDEAVTNGLIHLTDHCRTQADGLIDNEPAGINPESLIAELDRLSDEYRQVFHYTVQVDVTGVPRHLADQDLGPLFLLIKEAVRNACRHSGGRAVQVQMRPDGLRIEDDGSGLSPDCFGSDGLGCGSIQDRAKRLSLTAQVLDPPRNGWGFFLEKESVCQ